MMLKPLIAFLIASFPALIAAAQGSPHLRFESDPENQFLVYPGFVVYYDTLHKTPAYTIHRITAAQVRDSTATQPKRSNRFFADHQYLKGSGAGPTDYYKSGFDRGHHAAAGDFRWNKQLKDESFVMTNMSPQSPKLNRYMLASVERSIRNRVVQWDAPAWVVTGTLYYNLDPQSLGKQKVGVPSHIYKIAYYPEKDKLFCWLFDNSIDKFKPSERHYRVPLTSIERLSGWEFLEAAPFKNAH